MAETEAQSNQKLQAASLARNSWMKYKQNAIKSYSFHEGKCSIMYSFPDGNEMIEEFDMYTRAIICRKWKKPLQNRESIPSGKYTARPWDIEIGTEAEWELQSNYQSEIIKESSTNPICYRIDTKDSFMWKIKNIPYPIDFYEISVEDNFIIVRTINRKYFHRFRIPDLERFGLFISALDVSFTYDDNILTLMCVKPNEILDSENKTLCEVEQHAISMAEDKSDGPIVTS